ncbi:PMS1 protein homolog 1-like [Planococcus citri]|uniref:PMS1 protein homolog 1-like n=1 Tax=Planococcus citri TaxID=170843 RepID=UPI0031F76217
MSIQQLPHGVIKQISSAQVINSISSAVKELLENALDAGATVIDIKLERNGLDKIEIRDNGAGIGTEDMNYVCLPHYTSKIRNFDELERLHSYGFRGEALHSLCAVSQLSITTKTEHDDVASTYIFDNNGTVRDVKPSHQMIGTVITATNLFKNIPVRRQFYESTRKAAEELKKVEKVVKHLSIIHPKLRVTLAHNKCLIWHKTSVYSVRQSLMQVYPSAVLKNLKDVQCSFGNISIEMLIANRDCNLPVLLQPINEAVLFYINQRPVKDKKIEKVVFEEMSHLYASTLPINKCPLTLLSLKLPPESLDVNLEPNKTKVFIKDHDEVLKRVRETIMRHFYEQSTGNDMKSLLLDDDELLNPSKKPRLQEENDSLPDNGDLGVSQMRSIIIEKSNASSETAVKELADINLPLLVEPVISLSTSTNEKQDGTFDLNNRPDSSSASNDKSVPYSNRGIFNSTSARRTDLLLENDSSRISNGHRTNSFCTNLRDNTLSSSLVAGSLNNNDEKANVERSSLERENRPLVACDSINSVAKSNHSNCDKPLWSIFAKEDGAKKPNDLELSADSITPSQWSKGHVTIADEPLKGGVILFNGSNSSDRRAAAENESENNTNSNGGAKYKDANTIESSEEGRKDLAGFSNFAHRVRSEIIKEKPGASFAVVARELANRWGEFRDDKKKDYAEDSIKMKQKSITDFKIKETFKRKTLALAISANKILEEMKLPGRLCQRSTGNKITLIGLLENDTRWLFKLNDDVGIVDVGHLRENVLLHRYICNSGVPLKQLDEPVEISSQIIGEDLWNFVPTLEQTNDFADESVSIISDCRVTKNGFKAVIRKEYDSFKLLITEIATETGFNVIDNFMETLKLAMEFRDLEQCRPEAIKKILLNKVIEACEQKSVPKEATEVKMLLQYWAQCMLQKKICPHGEPISINLHKI